MAIDEKRLYQSIGDKIRELRIGQNYNQTELAKKIGLERTSVTNIETGKQKVTLAALYNISNSLNVSLSDLLPQPGDLIDRTLRINDDHEVNVGEKTYSAYTKWRDRLGSE
jgi:transcriptional regulator with XRE-family HTH domain